MRPFLFTCLLLFPACDPPESASFAAPSKVASRPARAGHDGTECLVDEHGLRVMALVRHEGVHASREPGGDSQHELSQFAPPYYVFADAPGTDGARYHQLGTTPRRDSVLGWVRAQDVVLWTSRIGAEPLGAVKLYQRAEDLAAAIAGTESATGPFAATPVDSGRRPFLWPVAESRRVRVDGKEHELLRVHVLVAPSEGVAASATSPASLSPREARGEVGVLDCVLLFDATGSMQPFVDGAKQAVRGLTRRLAQAAQAAELDVRFRLIAFRDHDKDSPQVLEAFAVGSEAQFLRNLERIGVTGGGDAPEAGLEALWEGLGTRWRGSALSTRLIFLVSDASFHETPRAGRPSRSNVLARAKELGVHLHCLAVGPSDAVGDRKIQLAQYRALAEGTGGGVFQIDQMERAAAHVEAALTDASRRIERRTLVLDAVADGAKDAASIVRRTGYALDEVTEILAFLEGGGVSLDANRPAEPQLLSGWLPAAQVRRRTLISRSELELALAALHSLRSDLSPTGAQNTWNAAGVLRSRPAEALAWLVADEEQEIALGLAARGIPAGPSSVLRRSRAQIAQAGERERAELRERVGASIEALWAFRTDTARWVRRGTEDWSFFEEALLP